MAGMGFRLQWWVKWGVEILALGVAVGVIVLVFKILGE
jgi:hypothetical protein